MYGVYMHVCWLAREDDNLNRSHRPHRALDGSEDDMMSSHSPELDSEHEEQDDSAGDSSDVEVLGGL